MDCQHNTDPLKLLREGTSQDQRLLSALSPSYAPVNERGVAEGMVFAQSFAEFLRQFDQNNLPIGNWKRFFEQDASVQLAVAAVQDVDRYRQQVKECFDFLNDIANDQPAKAADCKARLGQLFSAVGTLAVCFDRMKEALPAEFPLKATLSNRIKSSLGAHFKRLKQYYAHDLSLPAANRLVADAPFPMRLFGAAAMPFGQVETYSFSADWQPFLVGITPLNEYGAGSVFQQANRLSTHNLFVAIFDAFLKAFARTAAEAQTALEASFTQWNQHEPHYTLFLAFLRLHEYARAEANTLTGRHLDFYYQDILQLKTRPPQPSRAFVLATLNKTAESFEFTKGALLKAGKDALGREAYFANDRTWVANQAKVAAIQTVYRHGNEAVTGGGKPASGRLFASPVANSADGLGAELTNADQSWHPFFNKTYQNNTLTAIPMPEAEIGMAIASHYLFLAEGTRTITLNCTVNAPNLVTNQEYKDDFECLLTGEKGWIVKNVALCRHTSATNLQVRIDLEGADAAVVGYSPKAHGYAFDTALPVLILRLKHRQTAFGFAPFENATVSAIGLTVNVIGLKSLAISNDAGAVDTSKPFPAFGPLPDKGSSLLIGSKEAFQKACSQVIIKIKWQVLAQANGTLPTAATATFLKNGTWGNGETETIFGASLNEATLTLSNISHTLLDAPDFTANAPYQVASRQGFVRVSLNGGLGIGSYPTDLAAYLIGQSKTPATGTKPNAPVAPVAESVQMDYTASQTISLQSTDHQTFTNRKARFFHVAPFGQAEQHAYLLGGNDLTLLPTFRIVREGAAEPSEAECYIGIDGLKTPQNLVLLFQVVDGTADPLSVKPKPHIHWSYLQGNQWVGFTQDQLEDQTRELTQSGLVTLAIPRTATNDNTLQTKGLHWIRLAVASESDTVCRLQLVAAQAFSATFADRGNDPAFSAQALPAGSIAKLEQPEAAVKKIEQPFASFGGRGQELPEGYYTRVSERLRHKDRAIALWDYERLVLEAFPQLYRVKCLNHTHYEPSDSGTGIYRELAPGHVTVVTIPQLHGQHLRDPLKPYTSLGTLLEVADFLKRRLTCFATLHVRNPQFETVRVSCKVKLREGFDEIFYQQQLQQDITRFLSPWAFTGGGSPSFGGKVYASVLINFIEERSYVDYLTDFQLFQTFQAFNATGGETTVTEERPEAAEATRAVSILVSAPQAEHTITLLTEAEGESPRENCPCEA